MEAKKKKKIWPIVLIAIILVVALGYLGLNQLGKNALATLQGAAVEEVSVSTGEIVSSVTGTGNLAAGISETYIPYGVDINEIDVDVNDYVVEGKRVARINSWSITEAINDTKDAIKDVDKAIDDNGESFELLAHKQILEENLEVLNVLKDNREIYASATGIVTKINIQEYTEFPRVASDTDTVFSETSGVAMEIVPVDKYSITVLVDELDILSVEVGQIAKVTLDALPSEEFEATVVNVSNETNAENGVAKYSVLLSLSKDDSMRIGMNASVEIATEKAENILILPATAIQEEGGEQFVYTIKGADGTLSGKTLITTGLSDGTDVEIVSGVNAGDTVYYSVKISTTDDLMMMLGTSRETTSVVESEGGEG